MSEKKADGKLRYDLMNPTRIEVEYQFEDKNPENMLPGVNSVLKDGE